MALVADASAVVESLVSTSRQAEALRWRLQADVCHAPHLIDAEVGNVLRRRVLRGQLLASAAEALLLTAHSIVDFRYEMGGELARAAWALHANLTFYDALYAALAAALGCPLLTADARLSRAPGLPCTIELVVA